MVYAQLVEYLKTKIQIYKESKQKQLNPQDIEKIKTQIVSARKLIKDFYEYRERKITDLAIGKSRTKNADVENLLEVEKKILGEIAQTLDVYRKDILLNLVNAKIPYQEESKINQKPTKQINEVVDQQVETKKSQTVESSQYSVETHEPIESTESIIDLNTESLIKIKFTKPVPKFLGKKSEVYGPFEPDDEIEIDSDIANILINQNHAIKN